MVGGAAGWGGHTGGVDPVDVALHRLRADLAERKRIVVAFSGGADSSFLAWVADDVLGPDARIVTAVSPSLAELERDDCRALADEWGLRWEEVRTDEADDPRYLANDGDRCRWCKEALMDALAPLAVGGSASAAIALGVNVDDLGDHRPGQHAAVARGAVLPLVDAGFTKAMVREASRRLGLRTADKPAAPCLASRVPYGTPVTVAVLGRIERAERGLRAMGFDEVRVRHSGDTARVEVPTHRLADAVAAHEELVRTVRGAGYRRVTLDLEGLRSGNLNDDLPR